MREMTSNQPYLLKAFYEWIVDNSLTPYMVVVADYPGTEIPTQFVNNNQIVLNVSPNACVNFSLDLEYVSFNARFSGQPMQVSFPCSAVSAIYAKETGAGTAFEVPHYSVENSEEKQTFETENSKPSENKGSSEKSKSKKQPSLRVIK